MAAGGAGPEWQRAMGDGDYCLALQAYASGMDDVASLNNLRKAHDEIVERLPGPGHDLQGLDEALGIAYLMSLRLEEALPYYALSGIDSRLDELADVALWYGRYPGLVRDLCPHEDYRNYLKDKAMMMIPLHYDDEGYFIDNADYDHLCHEIADAGMDCREITHGTLDKMIGAGHQNLPLRVYLARKLGDSGLIMEEEQKYCDRTSLSRGRLDGVIGRYACSSGMRLEGILQKGDGDTLFPNSSNLYLLKGPQGYEVIKELLKVQLDFSSPAGFNQEREIFESVRHPDIINYRGYLALEGYEFMRFDYFTGSELTRLINPARPLPMPDAIRMVARVASVVDYLQSQGILYMDVKAKNILANADELKLLDMGMARYGEKARSLLTTPRYVAPEMASSFRSVRQTDTFQLGILLYELITGTHPFARVDFREGEDFRESELIKYALPNALRSPMKSDIIEGNRRLAGLLGAMLDKDPVRRPLPGEVARQLEMICD